MSLIKVWEWRDFNYWLEIIAALWFERGRSRKRYGRLRYVRTKRFEKAIDCQQGEAKRSFRGFVTVVINMIIIVLLLVLFGRVTVLYSILYCVLLLFIKVMLRCCGDCAFSASFVRESTDVSHDAGDCCRGNKGSGTETRLMVRNLFMTEIIIEKWNLTKSNSIQVLHNRIWNRILAEMNPSISRLRVKKKTSVS